MARSLYVLDKANSYIMLQKSYWLFMLFVHPPHPPECRWVAAEEAAPHQNVGGWPPHQNVGGGGITKKPALAGFFVIFVVQNRIF